MRLIPDDPIVSAMERTGYPPWISDDYDDFDDDEEFFDADDEIFYGNDSIEF